MRISRCNRGTFSHSSLKDLELEFEAPYKCPCRLSLTTRRETVFDKLTQSRTYAGSLEGIPNRKSNVLSIQWHLESIKCDNINRGKPHLIAPERRDYCHESGDMQSTIDQQSNRHEELKHIPEWLPQKLSIGEVRSLQSARDKTMHASLIIAWHQDDFRFDTDVINRLRDIDRDRHATDWEC